jgi:hypothetical protein
MLQLKKIWWFSRIFGPQGKSALITGLEAMAWNPPYPPFGVHLLPHASSNGFLC